MPTVDLSPISTLLTQALGVVIAWFLWTRLTAHYGRKEYAAMAMEVAGFIVVGLFVLQPEVGLGMLNGVREQIVQLA